MAQRPRKYRLWTAEEKQSICAQTQAPCVSVAQVARRYSMNANLIFKWLKDPRYSPLDIHEAPVFLPVEIGAPGRADELPAIAASAGAVRGGCLGRIEITLTDGVRLTVEGSSDGDELARLIRGLL
jgi:transposase